MAVQLRQRGVPVRAASRSGGHRFDWHDENTWEAALEGARGVYLVDLVDEAVEWDPAVSVRAFANLAEEPSRATGREIRHVAVSHEDYVAELVELETPLAYAEMAADLIGQVRDGRNEHLSDGVQTALGRPDGFRTVRPHGRRDRNLGGLTAVGASARPREGGNVQHGHPRGPGRTTQPLPYQEDGVPAVGRDSMRGIMSQFATGVILLTVGGERLHGMTANAFSSVSLDPPLVLCCVAHTTVMHEEIVSAGAFAVSVMHADQEHIARRFADRHRPLGAAQFEAVDWFRGPRTGAPLLAGALAWLECDLVDSSLAGDHTVFFGAVRGATRGPEGPGLLFFGGGYLDVGRR